MKPKNLIEVLKLLKMEKISTAKSRNLTALGETVIKLIKRGIKSMQRQIFEKNKLILMQVYTIIKKILNYCENKLKFVGDKAPLMRSALESLN